MRHPAWRNNRQAIPWGDAMAAHSAISGFRRRMMRGDLLVGTFLKTPTVEMVEILAMAGLDWICLDAEHSPMDRRSMDAPIALGRAIGLPVVVRVPVAAPEAILQALDCGAVGVLVPHVSSADKAREIARWAHFGEGGRGYAGSTRWAGFAGTMIPENLARDREETVVMAQIEDAAALDVVEAIAEVPGIDSLFVGPADLAVALGVSSLTDPSVLSAYDRVAAAGKRFARNVSTFAPTAEAAVDLLGRGVTAFLIGSELTFILNGARAAANDARRHKRA
jgi:2-keto-3-deoxy-L-rhamnonate aldolase RhmA